MQNRVWYTNLTENVIGFLRKEETLCPTSRRYVCYAAQILMLVSNATAKRDKYAKA